MEQISLAEIVATLRRQWVLIVGLTVLVAVVVGAHAYCWAPQEWTASATIIFEREPVGAGSSLAELGYWASAFGGRGAHDTFTAVLTSRRIRERVAEGMNLTEVLGTESVEEAASRIGRMYDTETARGGVLTVRATWEGPPKAFSRGPDEDAAPKLAAELANALVAALDEFLDQADYTRASRQRSFLEERLEQTERELVAAEDALVAYATQHSLVNPSSQSGAAIEALNQLRQREVNLRIDLRGARETEQAALDRLDGQERMVISSMAEQRNQLIDQLHRRILDLQREIAQESEVEGKSHEHPDVRRLQTRLEEAEAQLADALSEDMLAASRQFTVDPSYRELVQTALSKYLQRSGLEAQIEAVRGEKARALAELSAMPSLSAQYDQFQRQVRLKSEAYSRLSENYEATRLAEAATIDKFSVLDPAIPPRGPSGPSVIRNLVMSVFVAGFLATLLGFWRQGRSDTAANDRVRGEGQ